MAASAPIIKYQNVIVQVPFPNPPTQVYIPDQPNLRGPNVRISRIEFQDINILPVVSDLATANVPLNLFRNAFLTLVMGNVNAVARIPVQNFQTIFDNGANGRSNFNPVDFANVNIYWNKSYIEWPAGVAPAAACAFNLGIYYYETGL